MSVQYKTGGTLNTKKSSTYVLINLVSCIMYSVHVKKNNDNDNDKLQYLPRSLISQKYKKYSPAKYTLFQLPIPSGFYNV